MKKSLILLPLAAMLIAGCGSEEPTSSSTTEPEPSSSLTQPSTPSAPSIPTEVELGPEEYQGYRRVMTAPENDKEYLYGIYQANLKRKNNRFLISDHHRDEKGEYPYYLLTTNDVADAVRIRCHYVDETHYTIQIIGYEGEDDPENPRPHTYDGKYLEIYEGEKPDGTKVISLGAGDNDQAYWYFMESYTYAGREVKIRTNVMDVVRSGYAESEPVCLASYAQYETFSACTPNNFASNFISHLWEKIELEEVE